MIKHFIVDTPKRIDKLLAERFKDHSRSYFQYLIENGAIVRNGTGVKKREIPAVGDEIEVRFLPLEEISLIPEAIPLNILYEDDAIICIDKPAGMVVHPAPGHSGGTFVNALLHHCQSLPPQDLRPGIVHRLDKETTGVLLAAKTTEAHQKLIEAFSNREIEKTYLAITVGTPGQSTVDAPIARHPQRRKEMSVQPEGRPALTHFEVLESFEGFSLVQAKPVTGRTHQIRVHLRYLNTPILGDPVYGFEKLNRKMKETAPLLHAYKLVFSHPLSREKIAVTAPIPQPFQQRIPPSFSKILD